MLPYILIGLTTGSVYGLASMGLVLTYKTSGIFNLAQGGISAIAAAAFFQIADRNGLPWPVAAMVAVLGVGIVMGLLMEIVARLVASAAVSMKIVAIVGVMVSLSGIFILWFGAVPHTFPAYLPTNTVDVGGVYIGWDQLTIILLGLLAAIGLPLSLRTTQTGRKMRAVVDDPELLEISGTSAAAIRRRAWILGCTFAALAGVLIGPTVGLDSTTLTLLVIQAFAAAAIGRFTSLPWTYAGSLGVGIVAAVATKYGNSSDLASGLPGSLPFIVLFFVLLFTPKRKLVELGVSLQRRVATTAGDSMKIRSTKMMICILALIVIPYIVGAHLSEWTLAVIYVGIFLSLSLLIKTSNQVSLCQLSFAAIGAAAFHFLLDASIPWLLALLLAGLIVVPVGALISIPAIRLAGIFLALITLGFGILLEQEFFNTSFMFGASVGSVQIPRPGFAESDIDYYFVALGCMAVLYVLVRSVEHGQVGRLLRARADSIEALASLGANTQIGPVVVFCVSSFVAGVSGALIGPIFGAVGSGNFQTVPSSLLLVAIFALSARDRRIGTLGACLGASVGMILIPAYISSETVLTWLNVGFGIGAVYAALSSTRSRTTDTDDTGPRRRWRSSTTMSPSQVLVGHSQLVSVVDEASSR